MISPVSSHGGGPPESRPARDGDGAPALPLATPILIVEDSATIAWVLESYLDDMGFSEITLSSTGEDAIAIAQHAPPGLLVSDINLGAGIDGVDAAIAISRAIKAPVLFVTAYADDAMRRRISVSLPVARLLSKPVQFAPFEAAVRRLLARPAAR
jgi:CheY-like chemotaxis protein